MRDHHHGAPAKFEVPENMLQKARLGRIGLYPKLIRRSRSVAKRKVGHDHVEPFGAAIAR